MKKRNSNDKKTLPPITVGRVSIPRWILKDGRMMIAYPTPENPRKLQTFVNHAKGNAEAEKRARDLHNGGAEAQSFTSADRADLAQAKKDVGPFGVPVHVATAQWAQGQLHIRGTGHSFAEVIQAGLAALLRAPHPSLAVLEEFKSTMIAKDLHGRYRRGLENDLQSFVEMHPQDIRDIKASQIQFYLDGRMDPLARKRLGGLRKPDGELVGSRRRDNVLSEIRQLFQFARLRGYIADGVNEAQKVPMVHRLSGAISYFSIAELQLVLEHIEDAWLPFLVVTTMGGARGDEAALGKDAPKRKDPLRWEDFDFIEREIYVRAETAKTGKPRQMPILDNAFAYLEQFRGCTGPIAPMGDRPDRYFGKNSHLERRINRALSEAPRLHTDQPMQLHMETIAPSDLPLLTSFEWRQNAHRHTYGSYRGSQLKDMGKLSYEMGNSKSMCERHYHNPRPASHVRAWAALKPKRKGIVIPFPVGQTA